MNASAILQAGRYQQKHVNIWAVIQIPKHIYGKGFCMFMLAQLHGRNVAEAKDNIPDISWYTNESYLCRCCNSLRDSKIS